ncbi:MAG: hypothetical protein U1C74_09980 [Phenylobacterium sp.]|nr:hypothetical protein [Phenylobacterium sp.]
MSAPDLEAVHWAAKLSQPHVPRHDLEAFARWLDNPAARAAWDRYQAARRLRRLSMISALRYAPANDP